MINTDTPLSASDNQQIAPKPLRVWVELALNNYFDCLEGQDPVNLHEMVFEEIEAALFGCIMRRVNGNQSRAASQLGIHRSTLRKKLQQYNITSKKDIKK